MLEKYLFTETEEGFTQYLMIYAHTKYHRHYIIFDVLKFVRGGLKTLYTTKIDNLVFETNDWGFI